MCTLPGRVGGPGVLFSEHWCIDQGTELTHNLRLGTDWKPGLHCNLQPPWALRASRTGLVPFLGGVQRSTAPPNTPLQLSNLQSKQPPDPSPLVASMGPIVQEAIWLDPSPKRPDSELGEGSALSPPQPGPAACGAGAPLNVTYCLRGGFRKCQAPIKQPCSTGKTKKGLFIWDLFSLSPFPISSGLATV